MIRRKREHLTRDHYSNWGGFFPHPEDHGLFELLPEWRKQELLERWKIVVRDDSAFS